MQARSAPYALLAKPAITSYAMLKGKVISLGGAKDITRIYLERMLAPNGVKPARLPIPFTPAPPSARFAALQSGAVDAAILTSPFNFKAEGLGFKNLGLTYDYVKNFPFSGYSVNKKWALAQHKDVAIRFAAVDRVQAIDWFNTPANKDGGRRRFSSNTPKTAPDDAAKTWDFYHQIDIYDHDGSPGRGRYWRR